VHVYRRLAERGNSATCSEIVTRMGAQHPITSQTRFVEAPNVCALTTQVSASAWQLPRASPKHTTGPSPSLPGPLAGFASQCNYPRHPVLADDDQTRRECAARRAPGRAPAKSEMSVLGLIRNFMA
jgi:hypothetical protein